MIFYDVQHNTPEWRQLRIGIASASNVAKIITPTGKLSAQADEFADLLIAELILQEPLQKFEQTYWMERGSLYEADAAAAYQFEIGEELLNGGVFMNDTQTFLASPDRRVGINGLAEIKVPSPWVHVGYLQLETVTPKYKPQLQSQLLASEREWVDWFSYHPDINRALIRTYRDEPYIKAMTDALNGFEDMMQEKMHKIIANGHVERFPDRKPLRPIDTSATPLLHNTAN